MARAREFLKSLAGPHVLFAFAVGAVQGWILVSPAVSGVLPGALVIPEALEFFVARAVAEHLLSAFFFGAASAAAALLAKRFTGNTLVSACAGALLTLIPREISAPGISWGSVLNDVLAAGCGLFAAGVRLLPGPAIATAPLLGRREVLALVALVVGSLGGPAILAMPFLILFGDWVYAPGPPAIAVRRTGKLFPLHAAAVAPALFLKAPPPGPFPWAQVHDSEFTPAPLLIVLSAIALVALFLPAVRRRTLVIATAFALVWTTVAVLPRAVFPDRLPLTSLLASFGFALLIPTALWRIAIALTRPRTEPEADPPLPPVPALRDLIRGMRSEARGAAAPPQPRRAETAAGMRSTVEAAVAGAVAATLEQIRLAFRGAHPGEPGGPPERVLWNRLLTGTSGGVAPAERPEAAVERWRGIFAKEIQPKIAAGSQVLCAGATPWPLIVPLAEQARSVVLVERGAQPAQRAAADLAGVRNVTVVRHDRGLGPIRDGSVDAVLCLLESGNQPPAAMLALLRECRRVTKPAGVVGFGYADVALPETQEALVKESSTDAFVNRQLIETLARLAGFGAFEVSAGAFKGTSIAWLREARKAS